MERRAYVKSIIRTDEIGKGFSRYAKVLRRLNGRPTPSLWPPWVDTWLDWLRVDSARAWGASKGKTYGELERSEHVPGGWSSIP